MELKEVIITKIQTDFQIKRIINKNITNTLCFDIKQTKIHTNYDQQQIVYELNIIGDVNDENLAKIEKINAQLDKINNVIMQITDEQNKDYRMQLEIEPDYTIKFNDNGAQGSMIGTYILNAKLLHVRKIA